jgi:hypothetical protein
MDTREKLEAMTLFSLAVLAMCILLPLIGLVFSLAFLLREPRILVGMALALLLVTAITVAAGCGVAGGLAVWSYCFMAAGVILIVVKDVIEGGRDVKEEGDKP